MRLGCEAEDNSSAGHDPTRNDVKFAAFTLYEIITRDTHLRDKNYPHELDAAMVLETEGGTAPAWEKHEDVILHAYVGEYRWHLVEWMARRAAAVGVRGVAAAAKLCAASARGKMLLAAGEVV
ncbi:hypothetical protein diail_9289 [Diaporthe ilicicola]|nr:hypothetical protein diail_9289 [Diaporthe ilicicola]